MTNQNDGTKNDKRTNDILLGPLERPALQFFARKMPAWVNSDMLTVLGLLGSLLAGVAYTMVGMGEIKGNLWLFVASLGFFYQLVWRQSRWYPGALSPSRTPQLRFLY